jgi:UDP-N-acetylglucosamine acyltransferase
LLLAGEARFQDAVVADVLVGGGGLVVNEAQVLEFDLQTVRLEGDARVGEQALGHGESLAVCGRCERELERFRHAAWVNLGMTTLAQPLSHAAATIDSSAVIHPSAVIEPGVTIGKNVKVGPWCYIRAAKGPVVLEDGVELISHVTIQGPARIGQGTKMWPGVCVGFEPQDVKFTDQTPTAGVVIGPNGLLREGATVHAASKMDRPTTIGARVFMMTNSHFGHDCQIGDDVTMVSASLCAGHVEIGNKVTVGGGAAVHQFVRIGRFAFIAGLAAVAAEVPPFTLVVNRNELAGLNLVGMRRNGFASRDITMTRKAFREAFVDGRTKPQMVEILEKMDQQTEGGCGPARELAEFVKLSKRSVCVMLAKTASADDASA